jgi:hypothetical protein
VGEARRPVSAVEAVNVDLAVGERRAFQCVGPPIIVRAEWSSSPEYQLTFS